MTEPDDFLPELSDPIMIAAFAGWNDASRAASAAVEHLELSWDARPLAAVDPEEYYDYQVNRPSVSLIDGVTRRIEWPTTHISVCRPPRSPRDVVFVRGIEPNFRWKAFCEELLDIARELGIELIVNLGAFHAQTHYARPVPVSGTAYDGPSATRYAVTETRYEGPTGITGVFHDAAVRAGIPSVSFWAGVPYYLPWDVWPPATLALLHRVEDVIDIPVPVGTMPEQAAQVIARAAEIIEVDSELKEHVAEIEQIHEEESAPASGEALAAEFERYLKRRADGDHPD